MAELVEIDPLFHVEGESSQEAILSYFMRDFILANTFEGLALSGLLVLRDVGGDPVDDVLLLPAGKL